MIGPAETKLIVRVGKPDDSGVDVGFDSMEGEPKFVLTGSQLLGLAIACLGKVSSGLTKGMPGSDYEIAAHALMNTTRKLAGHVYAMEKRALAKAN